MMSWQAEAVLTEAAHGDHAAAVDYCRRVIRSTIMPDIVAKYCSIMDEVEAHRKRIRGARP
jgi:hypothetical protein